MKKKQVFLISNTHWDREWYMPLEKYMIRLVKLMDRLVDVMEKKPEYYFITDGQYIMVEDYLNAKPHMRERVKKLVGDGRLKIGPWYTQPLETIVTGEGMVRNLYRGITESQKLGTAMMFGYMIDEFGHASQMPQIYRGFGITDAISWRGIDNRARDVFEWAAPGGDIVYMHRSVHGYGEATALPNEMKDFIEDVDGHKFARQGLMERIKRIKTLKDDFSQTEVQFWLNGVDHSWAQENILEVIETINKGFPEYNVRQSTPEEYADSVKSAYKIKGISMQKFTGELRHPDEQILSCAHSTRADQKRRHYLAERILERRAEPVSAIAWLFGNEYPLWALNESWKNILENHAHDSLDCCSVDEVYERVMSRYTSSILLSGQLIDDSFSYLMNLFKTDGGDTDDFLYILNTNTGAFSGTINGSFTLPDHLSTDDFEIVDRTDGNIIDCVVLNSAAVNRVKYNAFYGHPDRIPGKRCDVAMDIGGIDGFTIKSYLLRKKDGPPVPRPEPIDPTPPDTMENEFLRVDIGPSGRIDVADKSTGEIYRGLLRFADSGDCGNVWIHTRPQNNAIVSSDGAAASITKKHQNGLSTEVEIKYALDIPKSYDFEVKSRSPETVHLNVAVKLRLLKGARYIGVDIEIENNSRFHQLRVMFPSGAKGARISLSGQPYDVVERGIGEPEGFDSRIDPNCEYHPMQDFCAVTDGARGLMIAAKGIYEYEAINDEERTLALTLLRSTKFEDDDDCVGGYNMEKSYLIGAIKHELAVIPFSGEWRSALPILQDYINPPLMSLRTSPDEAVLPGYIKPDEILPAETNFIKLDGGDVYITAVKREEKGSNLLIRVVSYSNEKQMVFIEINDMVRCLDNWRCDLLEQKVERISSGNRVEFYILPRQIVTIGFEVEARTAAASI